MPALMATSIAVCVALSSAAFAQTTTTGGVGSTPGTSATSTATPPPPVSTVLNGQINLNSAISDITVVYDDGSGVDATAASFSNDFTAVTRGSTLDLTSKQVNKAETRATTNVTVDEVDGFVGANSVAISNKLTSGANFAGGKLNVTQTTKANTVATTNLTTSDGWGRAHGSATAIANSATGAVAGFGNPAPLEVNNKQTNDAAALATVNLKTDNTNHAAFTSLKATAIGNSATYGADF